MTDELIQLNRIANLHNGDTIFFCKTDFLKDCFQRLQSHKKCILITGNSDKSITGEIISTAPSCIEKWYAQNADTIKYDFVVGLPIGLENTEECVVRGHGIAHEHAKKKIEMISNHKHRQATKDVYANFSLSTHGSRKGVFKICKSLDFITTEISKNHAKINKKHYGSYIENILDHKMVVCPRGNGIDCHRVWEVLYLERVPIIKRENAMRHFESLPIIVSPGSLEPARKQAMT